MIVVMSWESVDALGVFQDGGSGGVGEKQERRSVCLLVFTTLI